MINGLNEVNGLVSDFRWNNPGVFKFVPGVNLLKLPKYTNTLIHFPLPTNIGIKPLLAI